MKPFVTRYTVRNLECYKYIVIRTNKFAATDFFNLMGSEFAFPVSSQEPGYGSRYSDYKNGNRGSIPRLKKRFTSCARRPERFWCPLSLHFNEQRRRFSRD
jgi:hypothetical protein